MNAQHRDRSSLQKQIMDSPHLHMLSCTSVSISEIISLSPHLNPSLYTYQSIKQ